MKRAMNVFLVLIIFIVTPYPINKSATIEVI